MNTTIIFDIIAGMICEGSFNVRFSLFFLSSNFLCVSSCAHVSRGGVIKDDGLYIES